MKLGKVAPKSQKPASAAKKYIVNSDEEEEDNQSDNEPMANSRNDIEPMRGNTTNPDDVNRDRELMESVKRVSMGEFDVAAINNVYDSVCKKHGFDFRIHVNKAKEDGLRRQWGISLNEKNEITRIPSPIEYPPVMIGLSRFFDSSGTLVSNNLRKESPEKFLKVYSVDKLKKQDYVDVANECASMLVNPALLRTSMIQNTEWPQILAGYIHVAMKCCSMDNDMGHFTYTTLGHYTRSPIIVNNVHKFTGAGVQQVDWIHRILTEIKGNLDPNRP